MKFEELTKIEKLVIIGLICAGLSLVFYTPIFAFLGIILGALAFKEGARTKGTVVILVSVIFGVIGLLLLALKIPLDAYSAFL
ncbi:MAG: hypothetical protein JSW73_03145 [Candidatus Woesearchaeota archaeon]|nr:MAG: hypothetical protein JSW73_03145 [Candidatus Woesearchaeota archaeon]